MNFTINGNNSSDNILYTVNLSPEFQQQSYLKNEAQYFLIIFFYDVNFCVEVQISNPNFYFNSLQFINSTKYIFFI